jgi:phosphoribosylglycinamide formyltransferase-1
MRIAVLISGRGSNMISLAESLAACAVDIALVAANTPCDGLRLAEDRGLATRLVDRADYADRTAHEAALGDAIEQAAVDWICLAGYMAILSSAFVERFRNRIINIHPSLLPDFKGLDTHKRALAAGARRHGASVHLVTAALDDGPILLQAGLDILPGEDEAGLASRVLALEHALYPVVVLAIASGNLDVADTKVTWRDRQAALRLAGNHATTTLAQAVIWP